MHNDTKRQKLFWFMLFQGVITYKVVRQHDIMLEIQKNVMDTQ